MSFMINRNNIPCLRSFAQCEAHAAKWRAKLTKRNAAVWGTNCLPLHKTRDTSKRLEWHEGSQAWACVYHHSDVVTYYKDGRILLNASWDSVSTRVFFEELSPSGVWLMNTKYGRAYCIGHANNRWDVESYSDDVEWHEVNRDIDTVNDVGQGLLIDEFGVVLNPQPWVTQRTVSNRERRKEIIAKLKPFLTWYDAMTSVGQSMRGVVAGAERYAEMSNYKRPVYDSDAVLIMLDVFMKDDPRKEDEMVWREACWTAFNSCGISYWSSEATRFSANNILPVRKYILETAYKNYDGYKVVKTVVPPGKKP